MKRQRFRRHANPFSMPKAITVPDWQSIYERRAPMALDVGFGQGEFTLALAQKNPQWNVLGLEIREHLVENLLASAQDAKCTNLHALVANANIHLETLIPNHALEFVSINFPDPWFKRRHHKRRVLSKTWLKTLLKKLRPGAQIHVVSDYEPLGKTMFEVLDAHPVLENLSGKGNLSAHSTTDIQTAEEQKHLERSEPIYRMHFQLKDIAHIQDERFNFTPMDDDERVEIDTLLLKVYQQAASEMKFIEENEGQLIELAQHEKQNVYIQARQQLLDSLKKWENKLEEQ